jgi:LuxR family transcriptional regulator, maltose regulon positive regulatory protein
VADPGGTHSPDRLKFSVPGSARTAIRRPRLDRLLSELYDTHSIVEIAAAAGSGKTTQAALYSVRSGRRVAWLTLDRADSSGPRLVSSLASALGCVIEATNSAAWDVLSPNGTAEAVAAAVAEAAVGIETLVVLDEVWEATRSPAAEAALAAFLQHMPDQMHLLLLTREHLPLRRRDGDPEVVVNV